MELTIKGEACEIALLIRNIKGVISNDIFSENLDLRISPEIRHVVDTKAINELAQLTHTKRKEETL